MLMHSLIFEMTTRAAAMPRAGDPSLRSESVGERQKRELRVIAGAPLADGRDRRAAPTRVATDRACGDTLILPRTQSSLLVVSTVQSFF